MADHTSTTPHVAELLAEYARLSKDQLNLVPTPWMLRLRQLLNDHPELARQLDDALRAVAERERSLLV
jgi:hypothetical protein